MGEETKCTMLQKSIYKSINTHTHAHKPNERQKYKGQFILYKNYKKEHTKPECVSLSFS